MTFLKTSLVMVSCMAFSRAAHPSKIVIPSAREDRKAKNILYPGVLSAYYFALRVILILHVILKRS